MANMSYCRFENTLRDMKDCYPHLEEDGDSEDTLSETESRARQEMIELCCEIAQELG